MINHTISGLGKQIDLNENPQMPDASSVKSTMHGSSRATVNIESFIISTPAETAAEASLEKALLQAKKDSSNE